MERNHPKSCKHLNIGVIRFFVSIFNHLVEGCVVGSFYGLRYFLLLSRFVALLNTEQIGTKRGKGEEKSCSEPWRRVDLNLTVMATTPITK